MQTFINLEKIISMWESAKDIIMKFNFSGKWGYDIEMNYFLYNLGDNFEIILDTDTKYNDIHLYNKSSMNYVHIISTFAEFDLDKFKKRSEEAYPNLKWPAERKLKN